MALIGRPNSGKSTLLNQLLAEKVAIVSDKPQTTRHRIVGILSAAPGQIVFWDTPGVHRPLHRMNRAMVREALDALGEADVVALIADATTDFGAGDAHLLSLVAQVERPKLLLLNKIDLIAKNRLLPLIDRYRQATDWQEVVPISALTGDGCEIVLAALWRLLPEGEPAYDPELLTVHSERFLVAERIREKVLAATREELPFTTAVLVEQWEEIAGRDLVRIYATILAESSGQKKILVGKGGQRIKEIGTAARLDLEQFLGRRVFLDLHVRLEPDWRENPALLAALDRDLWSREPQ